MSKLKNFRESSKWSQTELAKRSGVPQSLISYIETGSVTNTGIETLQKLARALGITVAELLEDEDAKSPTGTCG
jgi:transcriptional regulator with XRE-family HTH domain